MITLDLFEGDCVAAVDDVPVRPHCDVIATGGHSVSVSHDGHVLHERQLQHGARRETHHGSDARRSLRELPEEELPGRMRRLLRGEHVDVGPKTGQRDLEGNCEPDEANSGNNKTSGQFHSALCAESTAAARASLVRSAYLERANDVSRGARGSPPTKQDESVHGIAHCQRGN